LAATGAESLLRCDTGQMGIELNHTIVGCRDKKAGATFLAGVLDLPVGEQTGPFLPIQLGNGVTLDYADSDDVRPQHYAFLVGDAEFDAAFERIKAGGVDYWADPHHQRPGELNNTNGGRGFYFSDPDGHNLELLTRA
jgi:catechol 2,3-dioxygenase-like lactoylglutathione lyase family enzyme